MSVDNLRQLAINTSKKAGFSWAKGLPDNTLDEQALIYINSADGNPLELIESCNPFAVSDRIADVASLFELTTKLRIDALTKEGSLINEILTEDLAARSASDEKRIASIASDAYWKSSGKLGDSPENNVANIFKLASEARVNRLTLREIPGHPFNLIEQILELRERYCSELRLLLARAETVRLILKTSFAFDVQSLLEVLKNNTRDNTSPTSDIADWLRTVSLGLEAKALESKVFTMYRLLGEDGWTDLDVEKILSSRGNAIFEIDLEEKLGINDDEIARVISIGVAPVVDQNNGVDDIDIGEGYMPILTALRSLQSQASYDYNVEFSPVTINEGGYNYNYPVTSEYIGGVGCWFSGAGPAETLVQLRTSSSIANRPIKNCKVKIVIQEHIRANWGNRLWLRKDFKLNTPHAYIGKELRPCDVLVGIRFVVNKRN